MTIRKILVEPDKFLRQKSKPVDIVDKDLQTLMDDMLETMYNAPGIGLAAIQVGVPKRVIVIDLSRDGEEKSPMYFVNPEIVSSSNNDATYEEGCLSVPGQFAEIDRPDKCHLKFLDYNGNKKAASNKDIIAKQMTNEQIAKAQELSQRCLDSGYMDC